MTDWIGHYGTGNAQHKLKTGGNIMNRKSGHHFAALVTIVIIVYIIIICYTIYQTGRLRNNLDGNSYVVISNEIYHGTDYNKYECYEFSKDGTVRYLTKHSKERLNEFTPEYTATYRYHVHKDIFGHYTIRINKKLFNLAVYNDSEKGPEPDDSIGALTFTDDNKPVCTGIILAIATAILYYIIIVLDNLTMTTARYAIALIMGVPLSFLFYLVYYGLAALQGAFVTVFLTCMFFFLSCIAVAADE